MSTPSRRDQAYTGFEVRIASDTIPAKAGVHMFELMRDGGDNELEVLSMGPVACQNAFHAIVALNAKLSTRGEQVVIYPTYRITKVQGGAERTMNIFRLIRKKISVDV